MSEDRGTREVLPRRRLLWRVLGAGAALAVARAVPVLAAGTPGRGGTLTVGLDSDATTLDPVFTTAEVDGQIFRAFFDRLIDVDARLRLVPALALSWRPVNATTWEFKLRAGVKFHDGTAFDAHAAKLNFDRMLDPANGSPRRGEIPYVKEAEAVDTLMLRLHLTGPFAPLPYSLTGTSGIMVSPAAIDKYGKDLASNPVGSGPFSFVRWDKGDHIEGRAVSDYWQKGRPYLAAIRYQGIPDPEAKANAIRSGTIDLTEDLLAKDIAARNAPPASTCMPSPGSRSRRCA